MEKRILALDQKQRRQWEKCGITIQRLLHNYGIS